MTGARGTSPAGPSGPVDAARNRFYQAGHRYARELDTVVDRDRPPFRREVAALAPI